MNLWLGCLRCALSSSRHEWECWNLKFCLSNVQSKSTRIFGLLPLIFILRSVSLSSNTKQLQLHTWVGRYNEERHIINGIKTSVTVARGLLNMKVNARRLALPASARTSLTHVHERNAGNTSSRSPASRELISAIACCSERLRFALTRPGTWFASSIKKCTKIQPDVAFESCEFPSKDAS